MDLDSDRELVRRLQAGDTAAFDAVYDAYHARLVGFLARLSRSREIAEDLAEETWVRFVSHAGRLRPDTALGPWLFTVARNLYVSYCRSRLIEQSYAPALMGFWPSGAHRSSPFEEAAASETERRIEAALAALPARYREALLLVAVEGMKPAEAAIVCGVTPEAMRQRLSRARALVSRRLESAPEPRGVLLGEVLP
jgi:RNA polymerase sigma-70 factor (ECF subfamily)